MAYTTATVNAWYQAVQFQPGPTATVNSWVSALNAGSVTPAQVQNSIITQDVYTLSVVNPVLRLYQASFSSVPDQPGQAFWVGQFGSGTQTYQQIANGFANSAQFISVYNNTNASTLTNQAQVTTMYQNILLRAPDAQGLTFWTGKPIGDVLAGISTSPEMITDMSVPITNYQAAQISGTVATSGSMYQYPGFPTTSYILTTGIDAPGVGAFASSTGGVSVGSNSTVFGSFNNGTSTTYNPGDVITAASGAVNTNLSLSDGGSTTFNLGTIATTVSNIANLTVNSGEALTFNATTSPAGWTGLTNATLNVVSNGTNGSAITVGSATNVTLTDNSSSFTGGPGGAPVSIDGGKTIVYTGRYQSSATNVDGGVATIGASTAPTGAVTANITDTITNTGNTSVGLTITGGAGVTVTSTLNSGNTLSAGLITLTTPTGAVNVTTNANSTAAGNNFTGNAVTVTGGPTVAGASTITVTQNASASSLTATPSTITIGNVNLTGGTATTAVTVTQAATATAAATATVRAGVAPVTGVTAATGTDGVAAVAAVAPRTAVAGNVGVVAGTVNIADGIATNSTTATGAGVTGGSIASVTLNSFGATNISSPALSSLTLSGKGGAINLYMGGALSTSNKTLTLNVNGLSGITAGANTITDNSNQFTTLNVVAGSTASTVASFVDTALTTLNLSGSSVVTFGGSLPTTAATSATTITVTGAAGYSGFVNAATTTFNAAGTSGANTITIAADATKNIIAGTSGSDTIIINAVGSTFTSANTGSNVTGFEKLGIAADANGTGATAIDASVFGTGINALNFVASNDTATEITNLNQNSAVSFKAGSVSGPLNYWNTAQLSINYADASGGTDNVSVTLGGNSYVSSSTGLTTAATQTIGAVGAPVQFRDANGVAIGTLNFINNDVGFNAANVNFYLADGAYSAFNFSGTGATNLGGASVGYAGNRAVTLTGSTLTLGNTSTNTAATNVLINNNSLGSVTFTGTGNTVLGLQNNAAGLVTFTNSGTGNASVVADSLSSTTVTLSGNVALNTINNNAKTLTLGNNGAVNFSTTYAADARTISGASNNVGALINLSATAGAASKTDTITLGNGNNQIINRNATSTGTVNVTVGTGSNYVALAAAQNATTGTYNVTTGSRASSTVPSVYVIGSAGANFNTSTAYNITGATAGDVISFANDIASTAAGAITATSLTAATSVSGALTTLNAAAAAAHSVAWGVYGGNTYIVQSLAGGTASATNSSTVSLAGTTLSSLFASAGFVTIGSASAATVGTIVTTLPNGSVLNLTDNFAHTITDVNKGATNITITGNGVANITLNSSTGGQVVLGTTGSIADVVTLGGTTAGTFTSITGAALSLIDSSSGNITITALSAGAGANSITQQGTGTLTLTTATTSASALNTLTISNSGGGSIVDSAHTTTAGTVVFTNAGVGTITETLFTANSATSITINGTGVSGTFVDSTTFDASFSAAANNSNMTLTMAGATGIKTVTMGNGTNTVTTGAVADSITVGTGANTITAAGGADSVTIGAGIGGGVSTINGTTTTSIGSTANNLTAGGILVGETLTFGNSLDKIAGFTAGVGGDVLDNTGATVSALTAGLGLATNAFTTTTADYYLSGDFDADTGVFTVTANGAGADTLIVMGAAANITANTSPVLLVGVDSDDLVTGNFA